MKTAIRRVILLGLAAALPFAARAEFPDRPLRIVVPFAPGGNIDLTARAVSGGMSQALGQTVVVENKPGAGGMLGAEHVARAQPDGYTMLLASTGSLAAAPALYPTLSFDPVKDFAASRAITQVPLVLVVNPALPAASVSELIALAKSRGKPLTMASSGSGTSNHLAGELFQKMTGVKFEHVPYRGSSQALTDLVAGHVDLMFDNIPTSLPFIRSDKLKALGVSSERRSSILPDLPTIAESGLPGYSASTTTGIALPAGTPDAVRARISAALDAAMQSDKLRQDFAALGAELVNLPPEQFAGLMQSEGVKWTAIIREAGVTQ